LITSQAPDSETRVSSQSKRRKKKRSGKFQENFSVAENHCRKNPRENFPQQKRRLLGIALRIAAVRKIRYDKNFSQHSKVEAGTFRFHLRTQGKRRTQISETFARTGKKSIRSRIALLRNQNKTMAQAKWNDRTDMEK